MTIKKTLYVGLLLTLALSACQAGADTQAEIDDQAERLDAMETQLSEIADSLDSIQSQLSMQGEEIEHEAEHAASPFDVAVAQYFLDTAGFHGMAEALGAEGAVIDPGYLSTVTRVSKVLSSTTWPEALQASADGFLVQLADFSASLEADDAASAASLSEAVHDAQHDLSHEIDGWLGSAGAEHDHGEG